MVVLIKTNYITQAKQGALSDISELCFCRLMRFLFVL